MIKINGKDFRTSKPADLDNQLIAYTGHDSSEVQTLLSAGPAVAARALAPFLGKDTPAMNELANNIAADPDAIGAIAKLYALPADTVEEIVAQ